MTDPHRHMNRAVERWLREALKSRHLEEHDFESIHLNELIGKYDASQSVALILNAYRRLISLYGECSHKFMAQAVVVLREDEEFSLSAPALTDLQAEWDHWTPPELYLVRRDPSLRPWIVEEYEKPLPVTGFDDIAGIVCAYYRCHRQYPEAYPTRDVYFEHYPDDLPWP